MAISRRRDSSFAGDVLKLASGTTLAQALGILIFPILTRIFAPEAFGVNALFVSITGIIAIISCLRYELSIMLPEDNGEAANLFMVSLGFVVLATLTTLPLIWFWGADIAQVLKSPELESYLWLVPPVVFLKGAFLACNYWNSRTRHFGRLSVARVIESLVTAGGKLCAGLAGFASGGSMIGATATGSCASALFLCRRIWREDGGFLKKSVSRNRMLKGLRRHYKFPLYSSWAGLLNNVSWQLPTFMLAYFFSPAVVGYYALGNHAIRLPMNLIGSSIAQVFFQRASVARAEGNLSKVVEGVFKHLVMFSLFPMLLLTIIGGDLFSFVFGERWQEAGVYAQILSIWAFFWFISSPLGSLFSVLEIQGLSLKINISLFLSRLFSLSIGGILGDVRLALLLFSITGIMVYGYVCLAVAVRSGLSYIKFVKIIMENLRLCIPAFLLILFLKLNQVQAHTIIIVSLSITIVYYIYIITKKDIWRRIVFQ